MEIAERSARWRRQIWESAANGNKGGIESRTVPPGPQSILKKPPVAWQWTRLPVVSKEPPAPLGMGAYTSAGGPASASSRPMGPWILAPAGRQSTSSRERQMAIRTISLDLAHTIVRTALLFAPGQSPPLTRFRKPGRRSGDQGSIIGSPHAVFGLILRKYAKFGQRSQSSGVTEGFGPP